MPTKIKPNELTHALLGCVFRVHSNLGPGLLESTYETCLEYELKKSGFFVERQKALPVIYDTLTLDTAYRIDLMVGSCIILEIKSVEAILDVHKAQLLTYLRLADKNLGFLLNFNVASMKQGIHRIVN